MGPRNSRETALAKVVIDLLLASNQGCFLYYFISEQIFDTAD